MSTSDQRPPYHHGNLPDALIAAAIDLLREGGPEELSLRAVARRAGVSAMAPYRHFGDKDALLAAVAERGFRLLAERLQAADAARDPEEALVGQGVAYVRFACEDPPLFRLMFGRRLPNGRPELLGKAADAYAVLASRVAGLVAPGQHEIMTLACWSMVHGLASLLVDGQLGDRMTDIDAVAEQVTRLLTHALPRT